MGFCIKIDNVDFFSSVEEVPNYIWDSVACSNSYYFNPNYLKALAKHHPRIQFAYIVLYDDLKNPIAFSALQIVDFELGSVQNDALFSLEKIKKIAAKVGLFSSNKPFKILTCGNVFVSGEHGIYIKENQDKQMVLQQLANSIVRFVDENNKLKKGVKAFMLKDFKEASLQVSDALYESNYHSFSVDPNMVLTIQEEWKTFDDYLAAMKTKFRVKAKKALELSSNLKVVDFNEPNLTDHLAEMKVLYQNVSSKANFNLAHFNIESFKDLKLNLKDDFIIKGYFVEDKLVGFLSAMINQNHLDSHFVGIDYNVNRTFAVYQRMLYDYVQIAIDNQLTHINFGRTASEIKSSIGAEPENLTIYLRHRNTLPNHLLSHFIDRLQPSEFSQKFPFKAKSAVAKG